MKFKPCPFCGSTDVQFHEDEEQLLENTTTGFIWCHSCGFASDSFYSEETVATLWNRRAEPENNPLSLDELRQMDGEPVYVIVLDKMAFADKDDAINGWGLCRKSWVRLWDGARADIIHIDHDFEDYGKTWLAYRRKPERSEG